MTSFLQNYFCGVATSSHLYSRLFSLLLQLTMYHLEFRSLIHHMRCWIARCVEWFPHQSLTAVFATQCFSDDQILYLILIFFVWVIYLKKVMVLGDDRILLFLHLKRFLVYAFTFQVIYPGYAIRYQSLLKRLLDLPEAWFYLQYPLYFTFRDLIHVVHQCKFRWLPL